MHAGGGLFGDAAPVLHDVAPALGILGVNLLEQVLDHLLFVAAGRRVHPIAALLEFVAFVNQQRHVAAVVDHQLGTLAVRMADRLVGALPVFFERLALPGEHRNSGGGDGGRGVILRRENVAARPADARAQVDQGLDQHRGLNGHVQRAGDADALQRLAGCVLLADRHQAGHFKLGDGNFLAAPFGQAHVRDFVFGGDVR